VPSFDSIHRKKLDDLANQSFAPAAATYIISQINGSLPFAQSLGSLTTGLLKNTVSGSVGILSRAIPGTDYFDLTSIIPLANGGTNAALTASNGGIVWSNASQFQILAGTSTAGQMLQSGSSTTPSWSTPTYPSGSGSVGTILRSDGTNNVYTTATYPNTVTVNQILYGSSSNVIGGITTATDGLLVTDNSGVPTILAGPGVTGKMLLSNAAVAPSFSTSTIPSSAGAAVNKLLKSDGTNYVLSTTTFPDASATAGKAIVSDGTNWIASTPTFPNASATAGKVIVSDGTNWVASTPTFPNASASSGKFIRSDGTNWVASTPTLPTAAGTSGKVLQSNGTNYVESTPTYPSTSGSAGTIIRSDGTNNLYSTATYPDTGTVSQIMYCSSTNVFGGLTTANVGTLITDSTGIPSISAKCAGGWFYNLSIQKATTTNTNDSIKVTGFDGTALSSTNTAWVDLPDPANPGRLKRFTITADVTKKISGATWAIPANVTGAIIRVIFCNDNGTLRTCFAYQGGRTKLVTTDTNATATSVTQPEHVLCDTAVASATNSTKELGYVLADFTQSTAVWAVETGVNAVITGQSADGQWTPWPSTVAGYSTLPSGNDFQFFFTQNGLMTTMTIRCGLSTGTSNATTLTLTAPFKQTSVVGNVPDVPVRGRDNGANPTAPSLVEGSPSTVTWTAFKDLTGAAWTNVNGKGFGGVITFQAYP